MYFTNEQVVEEINKVIKFKSNHFGRNEYFSPKLDDIVLLLQNRKPISFFYLTIELGDSEVTEGEGIEIPTVNMKLNEFFLHPLGDEIWTNDDSFKFITEESYDVLKDSINDSVKERYKTYNVSNYTEFVSKLNNNKKFGN